MKIVHDRYSLTMKAEALLCALFITIIFDRCLGDFAPWKKNEGRKELAGRDRCINSKKSDGSFEIECTREETPEKKFEDTFVTTSSQVIRAQFQPGQFVHIQCSHLTKWEDLQLIDVPDIGSCPTVQFYLCPLPASNESGGALTFKEFFNSIGAQNVTTLQFRSHLTLNDTLSSKHLEGLSGLKRLSFSDNGLTKLPEDLFSGVPDIEWIDMRDNNIILPSLIFQGLAHLQVLELGGNGITYLPPDIFRGLFRLRLLNIWQNKLGESKLSRSHFLGLYALDSLDLNSNGLKMLTPDIFYDLKALKSLNLNSNYFTTLPNDLFINNVNLTTLRLNDNRASLPTLPVGLFSNLAKLRQLSLESCGLEWLNKDIMKGSVNLVEISFSKNKLKLLPETLFHGLKLVENIKLSDNRLVEIHKSQFKGLKTLRSLHLNNNMLDVLPEEFLQDLTSLEELDLSGNNLKHIHDKIFIRCHNLRKLSLSNNQLSFSNPIGEEILWPNSPFHRCVNLQVLEIANNSLEEIFSDWKTVMLALEKINLSNNSIQRISAIDLYFISDRVDIDLRNNNISQIDFKAVETLVRDQINTSKKNIVVSLDNNPLDCNCEAYDLLRYLDGRMVPKVIESLILKTDLLFCHSPVSVAGKPVKALSSYSLTCDSGLPLATEQDEEMLDSISNDTQEVLKLVGEKCPRHCQCLDRPEDRCLVVNCGANLTVLPIALPVVSLRNYTELQAEGLGLQKLWAPSSLALGYDRVKVLKLGRNFLTEIDVHSLPPHLSVFEIHQNYITHLSKDVIMAISNASHISLYDNPWSCDCEAMNLLNFVQEHFKQVTLLSNVTCGSGTHHMKPFTQLTVNDICPLPTAIIVAACTSVAVIGLLLGTLAALYYRHQHVIKVWLFAHHFCLWLITEDELDKDKQYDAFISYSHQDEDFVIGELVPGLEGGAVPEKSASGDSGLAHDSGTDEKKDVATYKLCLHFRDWVAGEWIPAQIARSVESSCRTIVILSPAFLESVWGQMEFRAAHCRALSEGRTRVIVILYGDVPPPESLDPELRAYLTTNTYVKWGDPWFWQKLRYAMPHFPRKPYKKVPSSASFLEMNIKNLHNGNGQCKPLEVIPTNQVPTDDSTTKVT